LRSQKAWLSLVQSHKWACDGPNKNSERTRAGIIGRERPASYVYRQKGLSGQRQTTESPDIDQSAGYACTFERRYLWSGTSGSSSYGGFYEGAFCACGWQFCDVYVFFRKAYLMLEFK
jgi:hypothetical protein